MISIIKTTLVNRGLVRLTGKTVSEPYLTFQNAVFKALLSVLMQAGCAEPVGLLVACRGGMSHEAWPEAGPSAPGSTMRQLMGGWKAGIPSAEAVSGRQCGCRMSVQR